MKRMGGNLSQKGRARAPGSVLPSPAQLRPDADWFWEGGCFISIQIPMTAFGKNSLVILPLKRGDSRWHLARVHRHRSLALLHRASPVWPD